jgi:hypothetical protein
MAVSQHDDDKSNIHTIHLTGPLTRRLQTRGQSSEKPHLRAAAAKEGDRREMK